MYIFAAGHYEGIVLGEQSFRSSDLTAMAMRRPLLGGFGIAIFHILVLDTLEAQVGAYARAVADCAPLPPSSLQLQRRASTLASTLTSRREGRAPTSGGTGGRSAAPSAPVARDARVDALSLAQLCLRLNDCEWSGEQLLSLAARLRADIPGLGRLPGAGVRACEQACRDLLDYITSRVIYYELEPSLLGGLYAPTVEKGRMRPVLAKLEPLLQEIRGTVAPRWAQRLLEGVVSTFAIAVSAVLELPSRSFAPHHKATLDEDFQGAMRFFVAACNGVVDEQVVRASLAPLHALGAQACAVD